MQEAALVLSNASHYKGRLFGHHTDTIGEVVFQTGMVGYPEALTDPSYNRQILVLTYPLVGNYGVPDGTIESDQIWPSALVCGQLSADYSHWNAHKSLDDWMKQHQKPGLQDVDTRRLTKELRAYGTLVGKIVPIDEKFDDELIKKIAQELREYGSYPQNLDLVAEVTAKQETFVNKGGFPRVTLVDCGAKKNIERCLANLDFQVHRVPYTYDLVANIDSYDAIMLSNGPGDPRRCKHLIDQLKQLFSLKDFRKPIFGICLGHQLMGLAAGFEAYKLRYGNRGHNQPCLLKNSKRCLITSQNHGFALDCSHIDDDEDWCELFINKNDNSNEGIAHRTKPFFSVQFHPEHNAGPLDSEFLFEIFYKSVINSIEGEDGFKPFEQISKYLVCNPLSCQPSIKKVLILGSGGLSIGQAGEFDYSGSQAIKALKSENIFTILINPNIATVQTSPSLVDRVYLLPVTSSYVTDVIKRERPDGLMLMFGGQTALNCGIDLEKKGVLEDYSVQVLGSPIKTICNSEDRQLFSEEMAKIDVKVAPCSAVASIEEAVDAAKKLGYPVLVRAAYALGGLGSGFANDERELKDLVAKALVHSSQVLLDKSLKGWKELEYEVVRDIYDNCATICNMENVDPLGIHTGESIVVAPSQTLDDYEYNALRTTAIKIVRHLGVIGECNVQYALNPKKFEFYVIEVNPRLSRSSALASKATGYPLAYIAAKLALGKSLTELDNAVTTTEYTKTTACFEPSLDYCVVKVPRWDLGKFVGVNHEIGSSMKSVGEVMAIGRTFEEAFQKALRMVADSVNGFDSVNDPVDREFLVKGLRVPTDKRIFVLATALEKGFSIEELYELTAIDPWFLRRMQNIVKLKSELGSMKLPNFDLNLSVLFADLLKRAKKMGFSDKQIALLVGGNELMIRKARCDFHKLYPRIKQVDTVAAEWPARTNYLYLTYNADEDDIALPVPSRFKTRTQSLSQSPSPVKPPKPSRIAAVAALKEEPAPMVEASQQVLVLGSGVYRIGSSVEFDCCAVGCVQELRRMGKQVIMLNYNPETVSTDFDECEKLYFDEISFEVVMDIYHLEQPHGIVVSMGGQIPNNIAMQLHNQKAHILGTAPENIDKCEDRFKFSRLLDTYAIGQPLWKNSTTLDEAYKFCKEVGYPCIVRPSYVLSGAAMNVAHNDKDLKTFLGKAKEVSMKHPVVISKYIANAKEIDVDGVAQNGQLVCFAVCEHVENAGVHSGDATLVTPPQDLNSETLQQIHKIASQIALALEVNGPFNMQLIAKDNQLRVIECNLRASRSFPFVSKTLNYDFIGTATRVIMSEEVKPVDITFGQQQPRNNYTENAPKNKRVGVKVPQFSYSRLTGADIKLGVEMTSTGEVACFGDSRPIAYLKALISTGLFKLPERRILLLSIGSIAQKEQFTSSVRRLAKLGFTIYATEGTADYYKTKLANDDKLRKSNINFQINPIELPFSEAGGNLTTHDEIDAIVSYLSAKEFDLVINLPRKPAGARRVSTLGYKTRRFAVDHSVPLVSDIKCAKLLVKALSMYEASQPVVNDLDCLTSTSILTLPGLIDVHVHVREPGATHKEDFDTVSSAALAGGVTFIGVMPNTDPPITDYASLKLEQELAKKTRVDYGLIVGATPSNAKSISELASREPILALKMYLNHTYGTLCMSGVSDWLPHFVNWPADLPICVHAEGQTVATALMFAMQYNKKIHVCHVSSRDEILIIKAAKEIGIQVTCEVAPHHLFLTNEDFDDETKLGRKKGTVKPPLMSAEDREALWENLDVIDCFATDHAPHLRIEKSAEPSPPGFPGLETMLPLLLDATHGPCPKITIQQIVDRLYTNPKKIFNIPDQPNTSIEVDLSRVWRIGYDQPIYSRSQWTPFMGRRVKGKVIKVTLRGEVAFVDNKLLAKPGYGCDLIALKNRVPATLPREIDPESDEAPTPADLQPIAQEISSQKPQFDTTIRGRNVINIEMFDRKILHSLFNLAEYYLTEDRNNRPVDPIMAQKVMCTAFFENSTRTELSFASAMMRLGGSYLKFDRDTSSVKKGESLEDTIKVLSSYSKVVVLRHPQPEAVEMAEKVCEVPIINAGNGIGEHPTQALLDVFTIRKEIGTLSKKIIALVGDLKNGRTVHSLAKLLCCYDIGELRFVSPKGLEIPEEVLNYLQDRSIAFSVKHSLEEIVEDSDVIYMTRIQRERFKSEDEYKRCSGQLTVTPLLMAKASDRAIVMHPLPRLDEIDPKFDEDPRAAYFRQAEYGLYVRMALLAMIVPHS